MAILTSNRACSDAEAAGVLDVVREARADFGRRAQCVDASFAAVRLANVRVVDVPHVAIAARTNDAEIGPGSVSFRYLPLILDKLSCRYFDITYSDIAHGVNRMVLR